MLYNWEVESVFLVLQCSISQVVAPAVLGMVADVAAMKSRLNEFHRQRQNGREEEEEDHDQGGRTGTELGRTQARTETDHNQDKQQQFVFPASQAELDNCVPTQDTPVGIRLFLRQQDFCMNVLIS